MNMTNSATNFLISIHDFHDVIIIYMASLRDVYMEVGTQVGEITRLGGVTRLFI